MKKTLKIIAGLAIATGVGILIVHEIKTRRKLKRVADDGYETAHDILYPKGKI